MAIVVTVSADINASKERVWDAFNQPEHVTKWCFASDDWQAPHATCDLRVGGKFTTRMEAKDGSFGFDFESVYSLVEEHSKIVYSMPDGRRVEITLNTTNNITTITEMFDAETENPVEMQQQGWQMILNNFKKYVEGL